MIKESLRLASPASAALLRLVPPTGVYVGSEFIPGGVSVFILSDQKRSHISTRVSKIWQTIVGISHLVIYNNPDIFETPKKFIPERWLGENGKQLEQWNIAFSKGTRNCIGQKYVLLALLISVGRTNGGPFAASLSYLEMRICLATFFTRFDFELYETDESSMEWLDKGIAKNVSNVKVLATPLVG